MNIIRTKTSRYKLDTGVVFNLLHCLGDGQPVVLTKIVRQHVRDLEKGKIWIF